MIESSRYNAPKILEQSGSEEQGGYVTENGICERASDAFDGFTKMGCTTGETVGGIGACHIEDCPNGSTSADFHGHGVRGSADVAQGDSGGTGYSRHNGEGFVTHMMTHGCDFKNTNNYMNANRYDMCLGTAAYHINNRHWDVYGSSHS